MVQPIVTVIQQQIIYFTLQSDEGDFIIMVPNILRLLRGDRGAADQVGYQDDPRFIMPRFSIFDAPGGRRGAIAIRH
jgi:hypothetical protein